VTSSAWNAKTTAQQIIQGVDLRGKTAVVTGTSAGIGGETARALAAAGATVVMAARDPQKNAAALSNVRAAVPGANVEHVTLDLSNLASVRSAAAEVLAKHPRIDILVNNAGIMACPLLRTADGFEMQFGTNHVGHFLFTCLLIPALRAAPAARIVNLSSGGHRIGTVDFADPNFENRPYNNWLAYGQAKTANTLFTVGLTKRLQAFGITANAVHPGGIQTELGRHLTDADIAMLAQWSDQGLEYKTLEQGAATSVWAAVAPELAGVSGKYLEDCQLGQPDDTPMSLAGYASHALDPQAAEQLWTLSEKLVGQRFEFH
jgi:NAD(P)-dependent dehydrogenase (short-subunit alcohol dehydrogenase family)